jgi:hypothetical protein
MVGRVPWHPTIELANSNLGRLRHDCVRQLGLGYRIGPMGGPGCLPPLTAGHRLGPEGLTSPPIADGRWFPREHRPFALHPRGGRVPPALFVGVFAAQAQSCSDARRRGASLRFRARRVPAERLRRRRRLGGAGGAAGCVDGPSPRPPRSLPAADTGRFPGLPLLHDLRGRRGHAHTRAGCCEGFRVETAEGRRSERWSSCSTDRPSSSRTGSSCGGWFATRVVIVPVASVAAILPGEERVVLRPQAAEQPPRAEQRRLRAGVWSRRRPRLPL